LTSGPQKIRLGPACQLDADAGCTGAASQTTWRVDSDDLVSLYAPPQRNLEGVLAHELAHHLALPQRVSLLGQGSQLDLSWLAGRAVGGRITV
jgi:hypothetical protein